MKNFTSSVILKETCEIAEPGLDFWQQAIQRTTAAATPLFITHLLATITQVSFRMTSIYFYVHNIKLRAC